MCWDATLHQDGRIRECKAVDLSNGGTKIRIDVRLPINSCVVLVIDRLGQFPGEVRWQDKNFAGISFLQDQVHDGFGENRPGQAAPCSPVPGHAGSQTPAILRKGWRCNSPSCRA